MVVNSLKKVAIFCSCHNLGSWNIWSSLFKDVAEAKDGNRTLPEEVTLFSFCVTYCKLSSYAINVKLCNECQKCMILKLIFLV